MGKLNDFGDPVRDAMAHGEAAPAELASWPLPVLLRRLRIRFGLNRRQLAAKAGVSSSLIGRAEKGADVRISTIRKIFAAVGCRPLVVPAGALYDMDWDTAHLDNAWIDHSSKIAPHVGPSEFTETLVHPSQEGENDGNAISPSARR